MTLYLSSDALFAVRACQKGQPLQGLLLGTRFVSPTSGLSLLANRFVPFEQVSHLPALLNCYLNGFDEETTVVGWCLLLDRECALAKLASVYFDSFMRCLVRTLVANVNAKVFEGTNENMVNLVGELVDFLTPLVGLIVIRELASDHLTREFCAYRCEVNPERILSIINDTQVGELDLLADSDAAALSNADDLDPLTVVALNELLERLRAQELESPEGLLGISDDGKSVMRKTRRRRLSITSDVGMLSPDLKSDSKRSSRLLSIVPCPVEIHASSVCELSAVLQRPLPSSSHGDLPDLSTIISQKQSRIRQIHQTSVEKIEDYSQSCREYELLSLIYKVISQPDESILRKLSALEDYEDRLRKLGAKLRSSLSPEDLLRTLASIQGGPTNPL